MPITTTYLRIHRADQPSTQISLSCYLCGYVLLTKHSFTVLCRFNKVTSDVPQLQRTILQSFLIRIMNYKESMYIYGIQLHSNLSDIIASDLFGYSLRSFIFTGNIPHEIDAYIILLLSPVASSTLDMESSIFD